MTWLLVVKYAALSFHSQVSGVDPTKNLTIEYPRQKKGQKVPFVNNGDRNILLMDKETLLRLAQPAATLALAISISTLPFIARAAEILKVEGVLYNPTPIKIECVSGC